MKRASERATMRRVSCPPGTELVIRARGDVVVIVQGDAEIELVERRPEPAPVGDLRIQRALAAVRAEPGRRFSVSTLAKLAGASRSTFVRLFLRTLGVTPAAWLRSERLEHAARLLGETGATLAEIAGETGYASEFALSRAFKRRYGVAPGAFRRRAALARTSIRCAA
jgi:transcriptional regulator GlxA family with amidase domain